MRHSAEVLAICSRRVGWRRRMLVERLPVWTITFQDQSGTSSVMRGTFKAGFSTEDYLEAVALLVEKVAPLSGCTIVRYAVVYRLRETDPATARSTLSITPLARFLFTLTDTPDTFAEVSTPLDPSWVLTDGPLAGFGLDLANSEVLDFTDSITGGIWCDPFAIDLAAVDTAYVVEAS